MNYYFFYFLNVYLFLRERECEQESVTERERDTESEGGSRLQAIGTEPNAGLKLTNSETRPELKWDV